MIVNGQTRALQELQVRTIRLKRSDPLADGARIGFGIGVALGAMLGLAISDELPSGAIAAIMTTYGAMGTGMGVGVDAMRRSNDVIFSRPNGRSATLSATPNIDAQAQGVRVTLRF